MDATNTVQNRIIIQSIKSIISESNMIYQSKNKYDWTYLYDIITHSGLLDTCTIGSASDLNKQIQAQRYSYIQSLANTIDSIVYLFNYHSSLLVRF